MKGLFRNTGMGFSSSPALSFPALPSLVLSILALLAALTPPRALNAQSSAAVHSADALTELKGNVLPWATPGNDLGPAAPDLALKHLRLLLKTSPAQQSALDQLLAAQQDPSSPQFHKWLTPAEYGSRFGATDAQLRQILAWLQSGGFTVESVSPARDRITFTGNHAQLQAAFHVQLHNYRVAGKQYIANAANPQIPSAFALFVAGFASLNSRPPKALHTAPQLIRKDADTGKWMKATDSTASNPSFTITDSQGNTLYPITPYDFATIYNVKPLWDAGIDGTGQTIALVGDSDINPSDIDAFRSMFGLPAKKLNIIYSSVNPGPTPDEDEADLDTEWSGAVAMNATIDMVVGDTTDVSNGVTEAIAYVIDNNLAPILSVSYGGCELFLGTSGNLFFQQAWEQAAAQGITVMVAAGDSGSATCDEAEAATEDGLQVSGWSSTPFNVSVGGTDFYQSYVNPNKYWSSTNDPTTLASVLSYIPESIWNDSCANPDLLVALQALGVTDSTSEALCNDPVNGAQFLDVIGGGGGPSSCLNSDGQDPSSCSGGYPKPAWQTGVSGIPQDGVRDLPDVALMAGNGLWNTFYLYCESDTSPGGTCDVNNSIQGAGGTSFASPAFAGIIALAAQKTQQQLGNVNYILYELAAQQYANSGLRTSCLSANAAAGNDCIFYDVTDGANALGCESGSLDCNIANPSDNIGIQSGFSAARGYDEASGLGSVNAYNLVEKWSSATNATTPTTVVLQATGANSIVYGQALNLTATVAAKAPATGTPAGDVAILSDSTVLNGKSIAYGTLSNGQTSIAATYLPVGSYNLYARYAGDVSFAPSSSANVALTVAPEVPTLALTASRTTIAGLPSSSTLDVTVSGTSNGLAPTGTVTFTDSTTGSQLAVVALAQSATVASAAVAITNVPVAGLATGANSIAVTYSGDSNYSSGTAANVVLTVVPAFSVTFTSANLTIAASAGSGSTTVTATPSTGAAAPVSVNFTCSSNLPAGLACSFGSVTGSNSAFSSALSLQLSAPLVPAQPASASNRKIPAGLPYLAFAATLLFGLRKRRKSVMLSAVLLTIAVSMAIEGCGGSGSTASTSAPVSASTSTALSVSSSSPALGSAVTFTATVSAANGAAVPSGTVTFLDGTTTLGAGTMSNGIATFSTSSLAIGKHSVTANYSGSSSDSMSQSSSSAIDVVFTTQISVSATDNYGNTSSSVLGVTVD